MLEELLKYDKLGSKEELSFVLFDALVTSENPKIDHLKKYCSSNLFSISRSLNGILGLLEFISFVSVVDDMNKFASLKSCEKFFVTIQIHN